VVPFGAGGQTEQATRAARLEAMGLIDVLAEDDLDPARLVAAVAAAADRAPRTPMVDIDGAQRSAALLKTWAETGHVDLERAG
jgi:predicted glycosyltransferase